MATDDKVGKWNLGYGSNMNVKHITEKKGVKILGMAWRICVNILTVVILVVQIAARLG